MTETTGRPLTDYQEEIAQILAAAGEGGDTDIYAGKRREPRVSDGLQLEMSKEATATGKCWAVSMHNISEHGFAVWSKQKVEKRTHIFIRQFAADNSRPWIPAKVTHCTAGIRGFLVGAEFEVP